VVFRRPHDGLFYVSDVEMSKLNDVPRFEHVFGYFVAIDQNAVTAFEVTNSNALAGRNELGVTPRQERVKIGQLARGVAPDNDGPDQEDFAFAAAVVDEELLHNHGRTASNARSISAEL
jgi:hypothetical protein